MTPCPTAWRITPKARGKNTLIFQNCIYFYLEERKQTFLRTGGGARGCVPIIQPHACLVAEELIWGEEKEKGIKDQSDVCVIERNINRFMHLGTKDMPCTHKLLSMWYQWEQSVPHQLVRTHECFHLCQTLKTHARARASERERETIETCHFHQNKSFPKRVIDTEGSLDLF